MIIQAGLSFASVNAPKVSTISNVIVTPLSIGDHDLIGCVRKSNCRKYQWKTIKCRNYTYYNVTAINNELLNKDWHSGYSTNCPINAWSLVKEFLSETLNNQAPFIEKR